MDLPRKSSAGATPLEGFAAAGAEGREIATLLKAAWSGELEVAEEFR